MEEYKVGDIVRITGYIPAYELNGDRIHIINLFSIKIFTEDLEQNVGEFERWAPKVGELVIPVVDSDTKCDILFCVKMWKDGDTYECLPYIGGILARLCPGW